MSLIKAKDLSLGYESGAIVEGLDFEVGQGDYLCIVGENGSGKTTLMKTILGLQRPLAGTIEFGDGLKQNEIGYLPQQTIVQKDFPASVREIVMSGCQGKLGTRPFYNKAEKELAEKNIERLGLKDLAGRCYRDLSGGQQQRVLLARALSATEKVLLLDEPVSGLDPKVTAEMYDIIRKLHEEGIAVIMITHDMDQGTRDADHILHIGNKIFFGTKIDYMRSSMWHALSMDRDYGSRVSIETENYVKRHVLGEDQEKGETK